MDKTLSGDEGRRHAERGIREGLRLGEFAPGQRLTEAELADRFGVTRGAIRSALVDLTNAGLVERIPNRGARVREVSFDEAIQITECRAALEALCAAHATRRATPSELSELGQIGEDMQAAVAAGDHFAYSALNRALHEWLIRCSGQVPAAKLLETLNAQTVRFQFRLALKPGRPAVSVVQHLAIIKAVQSGDPDAAAAATRAHIMSVMEAMAEVAHAEIPAIWTHG